MTRLHTFQTSLIAIAVSHSISISTANAATINVDSSCLLRDAIVAANTDVTSNGCTAGDAGADTIVLEAGSTINLTAIDTDGNGLAGLPVVTSNISIQGNGSTITRDAAAPNFRLITLDAGGSLYLDSVTLTNGMEIGSAIFAENANTLVLTNSQVSNNSSPSSQSGVHAQYTDVFIDQSLISNNSTSSGRVRQDHAGISVQNGDLVIHDSTITGNSTGPSGRKAGIYVAYGNFEIINSTVSQNTANQQSGVAVYGSNSVNIQGSEINGNMGSNAGVYIYSSDMSANVQIADTKVNNNDGSLSGLYVGGYSDDFEIQLSMSDCEVNGNQSSFKTAGVTISGTAVHATVEACEVSQNVVLASSHEFSGFGIIGGADISVKDSQITLNVGEGVTGVRVQDSILTLENTNISMNSISGTGTASALSAERSTVSINKGIVSNNVSTDATGSPSPIRFIDTIATINETAIVSNSSNGPGGGIQVTGALSNLTLLNSTIANNTVLGSNMGGGLFMNGGNDVVIANTTISGNQSEVAAGMYSSGFNSVGLTNVTIANNVASNTTGGISFAVLPTTLSVNNTLVSNNMGGDCNALLPSGFGANNWFQDDTCNGAAQGDPLILDLADNGGLTLTHALADMSPLIDQGNSAVCSIAPVSDLDQRGVARDKLCDIGAYEFDEQTKVSLSFQWLMVNL